MTKNELRKIISPSKDDIIKHLEKYFKLFYNSYDSNYEFLHLEAYRILDTDIDFHVQYYKDNTICEIFFCTYAGGWGHKQQSIKIEFLWEGCYNYRICDKSGKDPIISEYKSDKKEDIFIAIDEYLISACDNNIKRNIKLINLLDA